MSRGKARRSFAVASDRRRITPVRIPDGVPEMIREDRPAPRPAPPGHGSEIDRQTFDARWNREARRAASIRHHGRDDFNLHADAAARAEAALVAARRNLAEVRNAGRALRTHPRPEAAPRRARDAFDRIDEQAGLSRDRDRDL